MSAQPLHLLVVDDDDVDRERVRRYLTGSSSIAAEVVEAASTEEALARLRETPFDCVLLDFRLGDRLGTELLRDIRMNSERPCPVIMITGRSDDRSIVTALQQGAYDYLSKQSLEPEQLVATVEGAIRWARLQARLLETERSYRRLIECLPQLVWTSAADGSCDFVSPQWSLYTGVPEGGLLGFGWLDQVHPEDHDAVLLEWTECVRSGVPLRKEFRLRAYNGSYRWFESRAVPARDGRARIVKWFGTHTDINDEREMREALQRQAELIDLADVAILAWSRESGIVSWNRGCEQLYGYSSAEAIGKSVQSLLRAVYPGSLIHYEASLAKNLHWSGELTHMTREGRPVVVSSRQRFVQFSGRWVVLEANRDITESKRSEEAHRQAQKMEALGTLASGIAHDFNNVLPVVSGNARLAREELPPDHALQDVLAEIETASARAADLVRRILLFARQEETLRKPVQLRELLEDALRLLRRTLPARIKVETHFDDALPRILADATQIHQVIMNLATNAAYAIGSREGIIEFRLALQRAGTDSHGGIEDVQRGDYVTMTVKDNGCGIAADTLRRIFDPFFTTKPAGEGTGLGLSAVHGIVKTHGGAITVQSHVGDGTTFQVYFPILRESGERPESPMPARTADARGKRILYVDDEVSLTQLMQHTLTRIGYEVTTQVDPEAALRDFSAAPDRFDAIVTDLSMPRMSGLDLARAVLKIRADMPVLLTSGYLKAEDEEQARAIGIRELIYKPDSIDEVSRALGELLSKH